MYGRDERINAYVITCEHLQSLFTPRKYGFMLEFDAKNVNYILYQLTRPSVYNCKIHTENTKFYENVNTIMQMGKTISDRKSTNEQRHRAVGYLRNIVIMKTRIYEECCPADCLNDVLRIMADTTINGALYTIDPNTHIIYATPTDYIFNKCINLDNITVLISYWISKTPNLYNPYIIDELRLTTNIQIPANLFNPPLELLESQSWYIDVKKFWEDITTIMTSYYRIEYLYQKIIRHLAWTYTALCAIRSLPYYIRNNTRTFIGI
jgi:hypothetical protein